MDWLRIRGKCAALLGPSCRASEIALVSGATEGINVILSDGAYQYDPQAQLLTYSPGDLDTHTIEIHRA